MFVGKWPWGRVSAMLLAICTPAFGGSFALAAADGTALTPDWPQAHSDVKADPTVMFGVLQNGMRYAITRTEKPLIGLSMRLRIGAGSLQESDAQQGIAHLLEHMAFRGSKKVPDGEVVKTLQRLGLTFGADTNAFTGPTQTVYKFDLPRSAPEDLDTGLKLLREVGDNLNITDDALATERGVVMSELRLGDVPLRHAGEAHYLAMFPNQLVAKRQPIGKRDIIEKADAALIRSYYEAYYRPERAVLVVAGQVDLQTVKNKIVALFSNWKPTGKGLPDPDLGAPDVNGLSVKTYFEKELPTTISESWAKPYRAEVESQAYDKVQMLTAIAMRIVNLRFEKASLAADAPFESAKAGFYRNVAHSAALSSLDVTTSPEKWVGATQAAHQLLDDALSHGVSQDEVDRVVTDTANALTNDLASASTRHARDMANVIVSAVDENEVVESPQDHVARERGLLKDIRAEAVTTALRQAFSGKGPVVFMTSAQPIEGAEAGLLKIFGAEGQAPVVAAVAGNVAAVAAPPVVWPYNNFGPPGKVADRSQNRPLDATFLRFANGVHLAVKHTNFTAGRIDIEIKVGLGRVALPKDRPVASFLLPAFFSGGLAALDFPEEQKALTGKTTSLGITLHDGSVHLAGSTNTTDLDTQLQLMTAYLTAPGYRAGAIEHLRQGLLRQVQAADAQAVSSLGRRLGYDLHNHDPRWTFATAEAIAAAKPEDLKEWLQPLLSQGPIDISIVGDVALERAIAAAAATFGALPERASDGKRIASPGDVTFPPAPPTPVIYNHKGSADKAAVVVAWPAADRRANLEEAADLQVLSDILQLRLTDAVRGRLGAGYSPFASYDGSWVFPGYGTLMVGADTKPDQTTTLFEAIAAISADLRAKPVSPDEFKRAIEPAITSAEKAEHDNRFFAAFLVPRDVDPLLSDFAIKQIGLLKSVTPDRIQHAAQKYLLDATAYKEVMLPAG